MEYLPSSNSRYKDVEYWDERYKTEHSFEWFGDLAKFHHLLQQHVNKEDSILVLGECPCKYFRMHKCSSLAFCCAVLLRRGIITDHQCVVDQKNLSYN